MKELDKGSALGLYWLSQDFGKAGQKNKEKFISGLKTGHALVISAGLLGICHNSNASFSKKEKKFFWVKFWNANTIDKGIDSVLPVW